MTSGQPQLWLLAGGNGAGKSTFYRTRLKQHDVEFVNADLIERGFEPGSVDISSYAAATLARERYRAHLERKLSFCYETVFSHRSKLEMLADAKHAGYDVTLVFIHLIDPTLNQLRVQQRVTEGGHSVPSEKIATRIPRTLDLMCEAVELADTAWLLDNSNRDDPFRMIATKGKNGFTAYVDPLPTWASKIIFSGNPFRHT